MISLVLDSTPATWTGSLPTWLLLVIAVGAAWRVTRGGGGSAVTELTASNEVLQKALEKSREVADAQAKQIAVLESKTDVVLAVSPLIAEHERLAAERHKATIEVLHANTGVLEAISEKLTTETHPSG
jgi:hypothetical protein